MYLVFLYFGSCSRMKCPPGEAFLSVLLADLSPDPRTLPAMAEVLRGHLLNQ